MRIFYSISLKDYFAMLETYFGSTYKTKCQKLLLYSDADDNYLLRNKEEYAEINPDVTIGEMMKIIKKYPDTFASFEKVNEVFGNFKRRV